MKTTLVNKKTGFVLLTLVLLGSVGWWQRGPVVSWYYVRQLSQADDDSRDLWEEQVADLEDAALPSLLEGLRRPDARVCANLHGPLMRMVKTWGPADDRALALAEQVRDRFLEFSPAGQEKVVLLLRSAMQGDAPRPLPPRLTKAAGDVLLLAEKRPELRVAALLLAAELVDAVEPGQWVDVAGALAERGLKDEGADARAAALHLMAREPMRKDKDLLEKAVPLLRDPAAAVRMAALIVLAAESDLVAEEAFLPLLHDDDLEVQHWCEQALRRRKLTDDDIQIARMITDKDASRRMRVFHYLHRAHDLNLSGLLRQLSHDPAPAVRAAAARAAGEILHVDLTDRLREMAADDPVDSVRQNANFYLQLRARRMAQD